MFNPGELCVHWPLLVPQLMSCQGTPKSQTTESCSSRASIMPPTHAIDAQGVLVSSPPKLVRNWSSLIIPQPSTLDTLTHQHRFICMSTTIDESFDTNLHVRLPQPGELSFPNPFTEPLNSCYSLDRLSQWLAISNHTQWQVLPKNVDTNLNYSQWPMVNERVLVGVLLLPYKFNFRFVV